MRQFNKVNLEIGITYERINGVDLPRPLAFVSIETEDKEILERIIAALSSIDS